MVALGPWGICQAWEDKESSGEWCWVADLFPYLVWKKLFPFFNGKTCHEMSVGMEPSSNMKQACMEETMKCERDHFYMSRLLYLQGLQDIMCIWCLFNPVVPIRIFHVHLPRRLESPFETWLCGVQPFYQKASAKYSCCPTIWIHLED